MKFTSLATLALCSSSALAIDLGETLPSSAVKKEFHLLTSPSQISQAYATIERGIKYTFTINPETNRLVYLDVKEPAFSTPEGIHVGATYADLKRLGFSKISEERGWASYVALPSGWRAAFGLGVVEESSQVQWLFKK